MKIRIICTTHVARVIDASGHPDDKGMNFHFMRDDSTVQGAWELDVANLYCPVGDGNHQFWIEMYPDADKEVQVSPYSGAMVIQL